MFERIPNWLRWFLLAPAALGAGFLMASVLSMTVRGENTSRMVVWDYLRAGLSGSGYVLCGILLAYSMAPRKKHLVAVVLGIFIIGDLSFIHLVVPDLFADSPLPDAAGNRLDAILALLRVDDFRHLTYGGFAVVAGAAGAGLGLIVASRKKLGRAGR